jgi:hypothetical protein
MTTLSIEQHNNLRDRISNNITKAHALTFMVHCAVDSGANPSNQMTAIALWAITDLLAETEEAEFQITSSEAANIKAFKQNQEKANEQ